MNEALLAEYISSLRKRLERIDSLRAKLADGNPAAEENARLLGHSLHGSGGSFGFPEISEAGKRVEHADAADMSLALEALQIVIGTVVDAHPKRETSPAAKPGSAPAAAAKPAPDAPAESDKKVLNVLLVEDDPDTVALVTRLLQTLPRKINLRVTATAIKAEEVIVKGGFDLIIMDLMLPDKDGRELINLIKIEFRLPTPLLIMSGIHNDSVRVECMSLGADKYLTKPFHEEELLREVKKLLGSKARKKLALVPLEGEALEPDDEDAGPGPLDGESILLAEDDRMQANLIRERLISQGASVRHVPNGREAMQLLRMQEFSLLILDVKMPVMDGFEVLKRVRGELKLEVPVIMVTAMGSEDDIIRGYDLGATDYILKPFSEVQLVARVKSLLR